MGDEIENYREGYYRQLKVINQMLEQCPEGPEREQFIELKQNIEELLSLTSENFDDRKEENSTEIDEEYALFMAEMVNEGAIDKKSQDHVASGNSNRNLQIKELEGKKFRAPHKHQWGQVVFHNAMVCAVPDDIPSHDEFDVKVLFINPTHKEMRPCPYYFNVDTNCNYSDDECGFSHGEMVRFSSLQDYIEPKFEQLTIGSKVLAKQSNELWYRATVKSVSKGNCLVKFDSKNMQNDSFEEVIFEHLLPLENSEGASSEDISDEEENGQLDLEQIENDRVDLINNSLLTTPDTQCLGDWEKHTKGIGSKLMMKMGYVVGTGLGKKGTGIVKPVSAVVLPTGKSLDFCMRLKEERNNPYLFHADSKRGKEKFKKKKGKGQKKEGQKKPSKKDMKKKKEQMNICEFITYALSCGTVPCEMDKKELEQLAKKLKDGSDKDVHQANFLIEERIKKISAKIDNTKLSITRILQANGNPKKPSRQLARKEYALNKMRDQALVIQNEIKRRKNNRELAVF